jgi:alkylhydroperoxidase family enzyme
MTRLPPISPSNYPPVLQAMAQKRRDQGNDAPLPKLYTTLSNNPIACEKWLPWAQYVTPAISKGAEAAADKANIGGDLGPHGNGNQLSGRDREIIILRVGWNCASKYEWCQHVLYAKREGITEEEIAAIGSVDGTSFFRGSSSPSATKDALLVTAADELCFEFMVSDSTWAGLLENGAIETHSGDADRAIQWLMDVIFAAGQYVLVCMVLNGLRMPPESE